MRVNIRCKVYPTIGTRSAEAASGVRRPCPVAPWIRSFGASRVARLEPVVGLSDRRTRSRAESPSGVRRPFPCGALDRRCAPARPGVARLDAFPHVWRGPRDALPRGAAVRRPTAVSRAAPWMADALRRVRRCTSRPRHLSFCIRPFPLLRLL